MHFLPCILCRGPSVVGRVLLIAEFSYGYCYTLHVANLHLFFFHLLQYTDYSITYIIKLNLYNIRTIIKVKMHPYTSITTLLAIALSSSSSISEVSSFVIKPNSYRAVTHLNLEDHIAEM